MQLDKGVALFGAIKKPRYTECCILRFGEILLVDVTGREKLQTVGSAASVGQL